MVDFTQINLYRDEVNGIKRSKFYYFANRARYKP